MEKLARQLNPYSVDPITLAEVRRFAQLKYEEQLKIKGKIAHDLKRIGGEDGFRNPRVYDELERKYRRAHASKKKLAILEMQRQ